MARKSRRQAQVLYSLMANESLTAFQMAKIIGTKDSSVCAAIIALREKGYIEKIGTTFNRQVALSEMRRPAALWAITNAGRMALKDVH